MLSAVANAVSELYALPLERFTAARNELATRARKEGRRDEAEAIRKLPKPSITAWALNQVAQRSPDLIDDLLLAGQNLARAQQALLAGQGQASFRGASDEQRVAVAAVVQAAADLLNED